MYVVKLVVGHLIGQNISYVLSCWKFSVGNNVLTFNEWPTNLLPCFQTLSNNYNVSDYVHTYVSYSTKLHIGGLAVLHSKPVDKRW